MSKYVLGLVMILMTSCAGIATQGRPDSYYGAQQGDQTNEPLFGTGANTLAESDIKRILNYRITLPSENRIAILKLANENYWRSYSNDFAELTDKIATDFVGQLRLSPRVYDASYLPSMLVPEQRTVPFLREAAARYQADLLLAYRTDCQTYRKYRVVYASETKAYCSVEAVLLDVRSGIVPFTMISTNEFHAIKEKGDTNFNETIRKAEMVAVTESLTEIAGELNVFLQTVETL